MHNEPDPPSPKDSVVMKPQTVSLPFILSSFRCASYHGEESVNLGRVKDHAHDADTWIRTQFPLHSLYAVKKSVH